MLFGAGIMPSKASVNTLYGEYVMKSSQDTDEQLGPAYDRIGKGYSLYRTTDPTIYSLILKSLAPCETILNVGAGTGCYEPPKCTLAVEPSPVMAAQRPKGSAPCILGVAEKLPLLDESFDGSLASLTIHHWSDLSVGLNEMVRVTRKRIVLLTWDPTLSSRFWLTRDYLPEIMDVHQPPPPTIEVLKRILGDIDVHAVMIPENCQDAFVGAFWKRPAAILDPLIQKANSAMALLDPIVLRRGIDRLRDDLQSGRWSIRNSELKNLRLLDVGIRLVIKDRH
jgi:SAM-dependent methyltransferase